MHINSGVAGEGAGREGDSLQETRLFFFGDRQHIQSETFILPQFSDFNQLINSNYLPH